MPKKAKKKAKPKWNLKHGKENDPEYRPSECPRCEEYTEAYSSGMYDYECEGVEYKCHECGLKWFECYEYKGIQVVGG